MVVKTNEAFKDLATIATKEFDINYFRNKCDPLTYVDIQIFFLRKSSF